MLATDLVVGAYAQRAKHDDAERPLRKIIFARAGRAKIRHVDGHLDGLDEWVPKRTVVCPWVSAKHSCVMSQGGVRCSEPPVTMTEWSKKRLARCSRQPVMRPASPGCGPSASNVLFCRSACGPGGAGRSA
jgi:hypothetical protein